MLLINKTLIRMSEGIRGWIAIITGLKILTLVGTVMFAKTISSFLSDLYHPKNVTRAVAGSNNQCIDCFMFDFNS